MLKLARWSTTHRKYVVIGWVVLLFAVNAFAQSAGTSYSNNFTLPNSGAQRAADLLQRSFPAQAGDRDTIVYRVSSGTVLDPTVRGRMGAMFAAVARLPHVSSVISPYAGAAAGRAISADKKIAFATVVFDEKANLLPKSAPERVVHVARAAERGGRDPGQGGRDSIQVELGGQAIEATEQAGFGVSTAVGLLAAIIVLLLTFGSLIAMGLPIITALFGLGTGLGAIALFTHVVDTPNFSSELAAMIGLGVGIDYSLFILTRFREAYRTPGPTFGDARESVDAVDGHGRSGRPVRRVHRRDRAARHDAARRRIPLRRGNLRVDRRAAGDARLAHAAARDAHDLGRPARAPAAGASAGAGRATRTRPAPRGRRAAARRGSAGARSSSAGRGRSRPSRRSRCC